MLAGFVQREVDKPDSSLVEAVQAARTMLERLVLVAAVREALRRATTIEIEVTR